jgi:hypothetical protein
MELIYEKRNKPIMKKNITNSDFLNKKDQQYNFITLSTNEMIKIKGGGKDTNDPPVIK